MQENILVYPPNKPMEKNFDISTSPIKFDHSFFIDTNSKGEFLLGTSAITSTWWNGTLFLYKDFAAAKEHKYSSYFLAGSTVFDGKFIDDEHAIFTQDNGEIVLMSTHDRGGGENNRMLCFKDKYCCGGHLRHLSVWQKHKRVVTCADLNVSLWQVQAGIVPIHEYNYHLDIVSAVCVKNNDENIFASVSWDKLACLWDVRKENVAEVIYQSKSSPLTSVTFHNPTTNIIIIGTLGGELLTVDLRQPKVVVASTNAYNCPIFRISLNPNLKGLFSVCADTSDVKIFECSNSGTLQFCYRGVGHKKIVRGLTWYNNVCYSCGFDGMIFDHFC